MPRAISLLSEGRVRSLGTRSCDAETRKDCSATELARNFGLHVPLRYLRGGAGIQLDAVFTTLHARRAATWYHARRPVH